MRLPSFNFWPFGKDAEEPASELAPEPPREPVEQPLREAAGTTVDADEDQWRRLSGDTDRDLSPMTQRRMQKMAAWLWESNPLANRIIELPVAYLLAEGVRLACKNEGAQKTLDRFWRHPINDMAIKLPEKVRELALFGEQVYPTFVNEHSGEVRLGYLDPQLIATVEMDPDNASQPIGIVTVKGRNKRARRYRVIVNGSEEDCFTQRTREIRDTYNDGDCFYFRVNNLAAGSRGRSDLLAAADWLDGYDEFMFGEMDRARFQRSFFYSVKLNGATKEQVEERARQITAPAPGAVRVHNESEEWKTETPNLQAGDAAEHARLFRNHNLGAATLPEHWFGGGGDVNRAVGAEMGEPTFKVFGMRQWAWRQFLICIGRYVLRKKALAEGAAEPEFDDPDFEVEVTFPELVVRDTTKWAAALQQVAATLVIAIDRGLLTEETAVKMLAVLAGRLGVEFDPADELDAARKTKGKAREDDNFTGDPAAGDVAGDAGTKPAVPAGT